MSKDYSKDLYKESGVDIKQGERLVDWLAQNPNAANKETQGQVLSGIGGFAGLFAPDLSAYEQPVLVAATDGVGTKLLLAIEHGELEGIGIDLVAMCVNDLYCVGANPLFFLDYFATGKLSDAQFKAVLSGIKEGLRQCDAALLGGETAELPGLYATGHFDVAGFVVGVVDKKNLRGPSEVQEGDALLALPSSGFHANGFSLLRKLLRTHKSLNCNDVKEKLLTPTKIYHEIPALLQTHQGGVHALANITGGGISGNLSRVIPDELSANLYHKKLPTPLWMEEFLEKAGLDFFEVEHIFNLGVGMIVVVDGKEADAVIATLKEQRLEAKVIGEIAKTSDDLADKVNYVDGP